MCAICCTRYIYSLLLYLRIISRTRQHRTYHMSRKQIAKVSIAWKIFSYMLNTVESNPCLEYYNLMLKWHIWRIPIYHHHKWFVIFIDSPQTQTPVACWQCKQIPPTSHFYGQRCRVMTTEDTRLSSEEIAQTIGFYIFPNPYRTCMLRNWFSC